jgi:FkbH-like protein
MNVSSTEQPTRSPEQAVLRLLARVDQHFTLGTYAEVAAELAEVSATLSATRVSLLASFTIAPLVPVLSVELARQGFAADVRVAEAHAFVQELFEPVAICAHGSDVVILAPLLEDLCPPLANGYLALVPREVQRHRDEIVATLENAVTSFRTRSAATLIVHNFALPAFPLQGIHEVMAAGSQTEAIRHLNQQLVGLARAVPGMYVLDFDRLCAQTGYARARDERLWCIGRAPLSASLLPALARAQAACVRATLKGPRKCLVLDLDDTLWGGVLGELGPPGIQVGHAFPGVAYREFQQALLELSRQGVLLAINSKNNLPEVEAVFRSHPDMVLKLDDFAAVRVNWQSKPENMVEIAAELNIALDGLVFFDDSPVERELMRQALPDVLTIEVPRDPSAYARALLETRAFDRLGLTAEDRRRTSMYHEERARERLRLTAASFREFVAGLQLQAHIGPVDAMALPRVLDLVHKTNQYNVTTRRYSAGQLAEMMVDPRYGVFCLRLADRFGDHGIVGAAIVRLQLPTAVIDTFLLSCRVIGRTAETALLSYLARWAAVHGARELTGEFVPTGRNAPAEGLFRDHGFTSAGRDGASTSWTLSLEGVPIQCPSYISLTAEGLPT